MPGDAPDFRQWRERVEQAMASTAGVAWRAVVDPASDPELPGLLWTLREEGGIWPLFMNTMMHDISLLGPLFVALRPGGKTADWFLTRAQTSPVGLLYALGPEKEEDLFEHLQNLLETPLPDETHGLLRFYDPRILHGLTRLPDPQWARLAVGPASALLAWEPGRAEAIDLREGIPELLKEDRRAPLPQDALEFLARHNATYAVLHEARAVPQAERLAAMPLPEAFSLVEEVRRSLERLSCSDMRDMVYGVAICLHTRRNIFDDDAVVRWMVVAEGKGSLLDRLVGIPHELIRYRTPGPAEP